MKQEKMIKQVAQSRAATRPSSVEGKRGERSSGEGKEEFDLDAMRELHKQVRMVYTRALLCC